MLSWDDSLSMFSSLSNDTNSNTITLAKKWMNQGYHELLQTINSEFLEQQSSVTTVASTEDYYLPVDVSWVSDVVLIDSNNKYPLIEIKSRETWNKVTSTTQTGRPTHYFLDANKGFGMSKIRLYPKPEAVYTVNLTTRVNNKDLSATKYTTGTAGCIADTVTGTGTTFTAAMVGRYIKFADGDGFYYKIKTYTSGTSIKLHRNVSATVSAGNYEIVELFELPESLQMGPLHFALQYYFTWRGNTEKARSHERAYLNIEKRAKTLLTQKTDNIIISDDIGATGTYPGHFPTAITD